MLGLEHYENGSRTMRRKYSRVLKFCFENNDSLNIVRTFRNLVELDFRGILEMFKDARTLMVSEARRESGQKFGTNPRELFVEFVD